MAFRSVVTLSRRESEVAELVRDGLTNREIANRLFLSERTVEGHVSQICNKLGVRSRLQIATRLLDDEATGSVGPARVRPFRVVSRPVVPPWWVLGIMAIGAPLPIVAAIYPWLYPSTGPAAIVLNVIQTALGLLFLGIPAVALVGLWLGRPWAQLVAIRGLIAIGTLVLLVAIVSVAPALRSADGFRPASGFELAYAIALAPLLLLHVAALVVRQTRLSKGLTTAVSLVWIVRYGYGLSLSSLVLWLLWRNQPIGSPTRQ